ncbi:MAG TPA: TIGR01777 family oxidoreductase [Terriglobia bacterium]|nr:TIGR01777 family oxidoreductase [Terriglobia bacterium]
MRILLTGSSGLIGHALLTFLTADGHKVVCLTRSETPARGRHISWDPVAGIIDAKDLEDFDAVVHLAGESIVGRWTPEKKARILESRVKGTRLLCESLAHLRSRPIVLVSASAIGFYGDRGDRVLDEESSAGSLFLSEVAKAWEAATEPARRNGIRVVNLRIGFVLSKAGGGLAAMLLPFKLGIGGRVGSGRQYLSWIAIDDVVGAISHAILSDALHGPVNAVAPDPVTNREFTKTLGRVLWRPTFFPLPAFAARMVMGEMADELLLASTRVEPKRLLASGYEFKFPQLPDALRHVLGKS